MHRDFFSDPLFEGVGFLCKKEDGNEMGLASFAIRVDSIFIHRSSLFLEAVEKEVFLCCIELKLD